MMATETHLAMSAAGYYLVREEHAWGRCPLYKRVTPLGNDRDLLYVNPDGASRTQAQQAAYLLNVWCPHTWDGEQAYERIKRTGVC